MKSRTRSCESALIDELGHGCKLPPGARVLVDGTDNAQQVAEHVRGMVGSYVRASMRPFGTCRTPLHDAFCKRLVGDEIAEGPAQERGVTK